MITVRDNLIFDPRETEIAVADSIVAVTVVRDSTSKRLRVISIRTMDPPARHTMTGPIEASNVDPEGLPSVGRSAASPIKGSIPRGDPYAGLESPWRPPMGGISRDFVRRIVKRCTEESGVGSELLDGLEAYLQQA